MEQHIHVTKYPWCNYQRERSYPQVEKKRKPSAVFNIREIILVGILRQLCVWQKLLRFGIQRLTIPNRHKRLQRPLNSPRLWGLSNGKPSWKHVIRKSITRRRKETGRKEKLNERTPYIRDGVKEWLIPRQGEARHLYLLRVTKAFFFQTATERKTSCKART